MNWPYTGKLTHTVWITCFIHMNSQKVIYVLIRNDESLVRVSPDLQRWLITEIKFSSDYRDSTLTWSGRHLEWNQNLFWGIQFFKNLYFNEVALVQSNNRYEIRESIDVLCWFAQNPPNAVNFAGQCLPWGQHIWGKNYQIYHQISYRYTNELTMSTGN